MPLHGLDAIQAQDEALMASAERESVLLLGARILPDLVEVGRVLVGEFPGCGIGVRVLYSDLLRNDPAVTACGQWLAEHGAQVRTAPTPPSWLLIVDSATALVPLDPTTAGTDNLRTCAPGIVTHLVALFEQTRAEATPLGRPQSAVSEPDSCLTPVERALLQLLAEGVTDETAPTACASRCAPSAASWPNS